MKRNIFLMIGMCVSVIILFMGVHSFVLFGWTQYLSIVPINITIVMLSSFTLSELNKDVVSLTGVQDGK